MAKIIPFELIRSMSGKVCQHSDTHFVTRFGTTYTAKRCNPRTTPYNETELKNQAKFKAAHKAAIARAQDPQHMAADLKAFKEQNKYKTLHGYLTAKAYSLITDEGTVNWDA